jgi:rhodanese-related sulfurtransferase
VDSTSVRADAVAPDTARSPADAVAPDTARPFADADGLETIPVPTGDAAAEAISVRADVVASDRGGPRADVTARGDTAPRADVAVRDALVEAPDAEAPPCQVAGPATLVRLTPLELKTILASSEDPYLINVKGTSIANIPGTDAVLANDVPGIEKLVGGDLCANIILYCRSGVTSQSVASQLIAKGYQRIRDLEGGIGAWTDAGYPTE